MIYNDKQILARAWMVREVVNIVLEGRDWTVSKIYLIGSYAAGKQNEWSDLDFLVELQGNGYPLFPGWKEIQEVHEKLDTSRIHVIFGTERGQVEMHKKYNRPYREISLEGVKNVSSPYRTVT